MSAAKHFFDRPLAATWGLVLILAGGVSSNLRAADTARTFATPEEAVAALTAAAKARDNAALRAIIGRAFDSVTNPDQVQATNELAAFSAAVNETNHLGRDSDTRCVLEVGKEHWPFPIPIVQKDSRWFFDAAAGREEILNRRVGANELSTLRVMRAFVEAQREYASRDRDDDEVLEFAQKFESSPGQKDGLFWPSDLDGEISPLGPLVASAQSEGYGRSPQDVSISPEPYHGYLFKILTRQGRNAPGGKYDYVINGNMIAGFAFVAFPAQWGETGVMTFIVNQQGRVYQKNLGSKTASIVKGMKDYNPDKTWTVSPD